MEWASVLLAALQIIQAIAGWLAQKQSADSALAQVLSTELSKALGEIKNAQDIRKNIRDGAAAAPTELRNDDGFRRD